MRDTDIVGSVRAKPNRTDLGIAQGEKYTSALNGELKPYFQPCSVERIGIFSVVNV